MAGPDLSRATERVLSLMDDTVTVHRDRPGVYDDELDETTGELIPAEAGSAVWSGPALITPRTDNDGTPEPDPNGLYDSGSSPRYRALIPLTSPQVEAGDVLTVTSSRRDPQLVGERFRIDAAGQVSTYTVARSVGLIRILR